MGRRIIFVMLAVGLGALTACFHSENPEIRLQRLVLDAYSQHRNLELRIRGASYRELSQPDDVASIPFSRAPALVEAEKTIANLSSAQRYSLEILPDIGRVNLLEWAYEPAISNLQQALSQNASSPWLLNDLASAYFERAVREDRFIDYGQAYELQSKALRLQPDDEVALFNRAITAERLFLFQRSESDWENYLRKDTSSKWAREAREHLDRVRVRVAQQAALVGQPLLTLQEFGAKIDPRNRQTWQLIEPRIEEYLTVATAEWLPTAFSKHAVSKDSGKAEQSLYALAIVR